MGDAGRKLPSGAHAARAPLPEPRVTIDCSCVAHRTVTSPSSLVPRHGRVVPRRRGKRSTRRYIHRVSPARRTALNALAIFGVWTTLGLLACAQGALFLSQAGQHFTWGMFA